MTLEDFRKYWLTEHAVLVLKVPELVKYVQSHTMDSGYRDHEPIYDGIGAGIFGVVSVIVVADLARDTGRFNFILGAINTGVSIGASVSNLMTGFIVKRSGYNFGFIVLAMIAAVALASLLFAMPETKDTGDEPKSMPSFERGPKGARSAAPQALPRRSKAESREN